LEVPVPVHVGKFSEWFPWPWSVVNWIEGNTAESHPFTTSDVATLAESLVALHQPAPEDAPVNPFRGVPLQTKNETTEQRLISLGQRTDIDASRLAPIWQEACAAPRAEHRVWLHGDLHPRNVVVRSGALVGLIDWGDLNGGDAATDVACIWMLIDSARYRREFLAAYSASEALVCRAKGWAVHLGLAHALSGEPRHVTIGLAALARVLADS
jgi:aminoglycoside phosphotransferase (APT) family kinase protein